MSYNLLNRLRYHSFWILDALKGGGIKSDIKDIRASFELESFDSLKEKNQNYLKELLDKATSESDFYKPFKNYKSLDDFPVINKTIIRNNFDDIRPKTLRNEKCYFIYTSGSTGTPFKICQNERKKNRNTADTLFFAERAGYTLGEKLLYLRLWTDRLKKSRISAALQNIVQLDICELEDKQIHNLLMKLQKDKSPKGWLGYPSGMEKICNYLEAQNSKPLDCNINSIIGISENLSDHVRSKMWHYFGSPMVSRYSNTENGIIAQQSIDSHYFIINWASYIVEILDFNSNEPVKNGGLGRIVITDLFNHATPMIRYDTGDIGAIDIKPNQRFPVLCSVEGRQSDILFNTEGKMVSPFKFMSIVPEFPELKQIQFIQTGKIHYTVKINVSGTFARENELMALFKSYIGNNAQVSIDYVDEIPTLISKKRKITRNILVEKSKLENLTFTL
ncbi:AMP-binding protein [Flagellimonas pelagia]|uniref:Phenylacetate--CoA ligase family protein n=1 Tax=Flagellimonas pelagia TaxID=2306998 RepID=A0A3A1NQP9_9FLAO|nr:AMP-binding protein [Allomuricauda maritima]RIV46060.1 phenylacetate--CoA ligase family protein [Allomuricauda maritima]TXJ98830.1 phenylacetate--CoA ligase family protein [Allomuricauda maritima]